MKANPSETVEEIMKRISQFDILSHYFNITSLPVLINSPLRRDEHPSFSIYSPDGVRVLYTDHAERDEYGDIYTLMQKCYGLSFSQVMRKIAAEMPASLIGSKMSLRTTYARNLPHYDTDIKVKIREWQAHDIAYWESYGISLDWLKHAEVYPISHKIVYKAGQRYVFHAAKYAYAFVERKEDKVTLKVYQPFSKQFKWANKNDGSVVGLWTKIPKKGDRLVICSSLKDALCLWANTGIPCIYVQSETTGMSETAQRVLRERYKRIFICFDNDEPGLRDGEQFAKETGFTNIVIPKFDGGKDISDLYKTRGKEEFVNILKPLFE